jgi:hypothetical protein
MLNASPTAIDFDVYQPRNPKISGYYPPRRINPLLCPKCLGSMKIIYFIEDEQIISKILKQNYCAPFFLDIQG